MNRQRRRRSGFTLVEVLTVVGIIVVLIGIVAIGMSVISGQAHTRVAGTALGNLRGMLTEYETGGGDLRKLYSLYGSNGVNNTENSRRTTDTTTVPWNLNDTKVKSEPAVNRTVAVMKLLLQNPKNRQTFDALPQEYKGLNNTLMVDGQGYPILFVPPGGLINCTRNSTAWTDRSSDGRPFFVSPGADGLFDKADDNQESYNQQ